jgi:uncharacterized membrane protein YbhN (UPF0104 family)
VVVRAVLLLVAGLSLYLLLPGLIETFGSWPQLRGIDPWWAGLATLFEAMSFIATWALQRIALRSRSWFAVGCSQLAANAAGRIVPGGAAAAGALQYTMLVRAGIPGARVAGALTATLAATAGTVLTLPLVASLAALGGTAAPGKLRQISYFGLAAFLAFALVAVVAFVWDRPLALVGRAVRSAGGLVGARPRLELLPRKLLTQRDAIRRALQLHPALAFLSAFGKWGFDYLALVCILRALDVHPDPAFVLIAYAAAAVLGMIPITPGGLGFVEAGLTGMLILAGVDAAAAAAATLAYRLVSYWLPLPAGLVGYVLARRRYGSSTASTSGATSEITISPS